MNNKTGKKPIKTTLLTLAVIGGLGIAWQPLAALGRNAAAFSVSFGRVSSSAVSQTRQGGLHNTEGGEEENLADEPLSYATETPQEQLPLTAPAQNGKVPKELGNGGKVSEQQMFAGSSFIQGVTIRNKSGAAIDIAKQLAIKPKINITGTDKPQVLIVHTHTTESYMSYYGGFYNADDKTRSKDETQNIVAVGRMVANRLRAQGIAVVHDTTIHDEPYSGAYSRSEKTVKKNLEKHPTIQVVLDLHRDGLMVNSTTKLKPTTVINGKKAAQLMMITCGVNNPANPLPNWQENLRFALRLQGAVHNQYTNLARPLGVGVSRYNQHLTNGSLLVEIGSDSNTLEEALYTAQLFGDILAGVLLSLKM